MTRQALIFEDAGWRDLYPITLSRPAFDARTGTTTLGRRLVAQLSPLEVKRADFLCRPLLRPLVERDHPGHAVNHDPDGDVLFLNGRLLCLDKSLEEILDLTARAVAIVDHGTVVAARATGPEALAYATTLGQALTAGALPPPPPDHAVAGLPPGAHLARRPWDLVAHNGRVLEADFEWANRPHLQRPPDLAPGAQTLHREHILCREGVRVEAGAILDAASGPILLAENARVLHNAVVLGPAYLGPGTTIKVGARIEGPVSLGPVCKVGGEVEGSVFQGYGNKQHDGFLGHAYVGAWTNLGAGTTNSDLKNNYGTVRVWTPEGEVDTGERFVGLFLGDHSKTAIGTLFNTGTVVGFSANLFGAGFPPKHVPSFSWGGAVGLSHYDLEKALETARAVMKRRKLEMEPADEVLFRAIHAERAAWGASDRTSKSDGSGS